MYTFCGFGFELVAVDSMDSEGIAYTLEWPLRQTISFFCVENRVRSLIAKLKKMFRAFTTSESLNFLPALRSDRTVSLVGRIGVVEPSVGVLPCQGSIKMP